MAAGDWYRATIRVRDTGENTCGGGREYEDENLLYSFDGGDFESLELIPPTLPTKLGALVLLTLPDGEEERILSVTSNNGDGVMWANTEGSHYRNSWVAEQGWRLLLDGTDEE